VANRYLEIIRASDVEPCGKSPPSEGGTAHETAVGHYAETITALRARCPDHVPAERWWRAIADSDAFLNRWGEQAHMLGWTVRDLWGLHTPPKNPHATYSRLSRYDQTGLIWLLEGSRGRRTDQHHRRYPMARRLAHDVLQNTLISHGRPEDLHIH
jgi:hypothetical protein